MFRKVQDTTFGSAKSTFLESRSDIICFQWLSNLLLSSLLRFLLRFSSVMFAMALTVMSKTMFSLLFLSLATIHSVSAWGTLGHETIGYMAQNFVNNHTQAWAQSILNDTSASYLGKIATWADDYKYTSEGAFSSAFHYIDAEDNPPTSCNVDFDRDCGDEGCSVSAIANYTLRVQQSGNLSQQEVNYALRFLVHFIGDITQPLHDEAFEVGGNDVNVTFDGEDTNLHSIWDTEMPEELRGGYSLHDAKLWAANLTAEINNGTFASAKDSWLTGLDISDPKGSAMVWARDANKYVCSVVMPDGVDTLESGDLYPGYYNGAIDTVELQIAKAGYRLAAWLDAIAAKETVSKRSERRNWKIGTVGVESDLSGSDLLPTPKELKSKARLRREAVGWGCNHKH